MWACCMADRQEGLAFLILSPRCFLLKCIPPIDSLWSSAPATQGSGAGDQAIQTCRCLWALPAKPPSRDSIIQGRRALGSIATCYPVLGPRYCIPAL